MIQAVAYDPDGYPNQYKYKINEWTERHFSPMDWLLVRVQLWSSDETKHMVATDFRGEDDDLSCMLTDPMGGYRVHLLVRTATKFEVVKVIYTGE